VSFFCPVGASEPSKCPSGTQAGEGSADASQCAAISAPPLPPAAVAAVVICVLADLLHAFFFIRRVGAKRSSVKAWILACIMLGPLVWIVWWCRQHALRSADTSEPANVLPLLFETSREDIQRPNRNGPTYSEMILKPSAPPAEGEEEDFAATQPFFRHASGGNARAAAAAVALAHEPAASNVSLESNLDKPPEFMTDQCSPHPPSPLTSHSRAAAIHMLVLCVASVL
jgi:hypothetical protein